MSTQGAAPAKREFPAWTRRPDSVQAQYRGRELRVSCATRAPSGCRTRLFEILGSSRCTGAVPANVTCFELKAFATSSDPEA